MSAGETIATASLVVSVVALFVGIVATIASVRAITRDRAKLRLQTQDGAAGTQYLHVVNVGLRPVRLMRVFSGDDHGGPILTSACSSYP